VNCFGVDAWAENERSNQLRQSAAVTSACCRAKEVRRLNEEAGRLIMSCAPPTGSRAKKQFIIFPFARNGGLKAGEG